MLCVALCRSDQLLAAPVLLSHGLHESRSALSTAGHCNVKPDSPHRRSAQADQQKQQAAEQAAAQARKTAEREAAEAAAAAAEADRAAAERSAALARKEAALPPEPAAGQAADTVAILVRMPDGSRLSRRCRIHNLFQTLNRNGKLTMPTL